MTTLPESYRARLKDLTILVIRHGSHGTWAWVISRDGKEIAKHDPVMPFHQDEHDAKLEAVKRAVEILLPQYSEEVLESLAWETSGSATHL
jgi:hypothetical protein